MDTPALKVYRNSLADVLPDGRIVGGNDIQFNSCASDSRVCRAGDVFVAMVGTESDGHDFVAEAIRNGARAIVAERLVLAQGVPVCIVPDARVAYGQVCQHLAGNPSRRMKVVGITGTNGKTSTSLLIQSVFNAAGIQSGVMGSLGYCDGSQTGAASLTTPGAHVLADYLARMAANGCTHGIVEVSSHALAQSRTAGMEFDTACVTNVRRDHLDFHGSLENYRSAKARLFDQVRPSGVVVVNSDDPVCRKFLDEIDLPALTVGIRNAAEVTASLVERVPSEQTFLIQCGSNTTPVRTRIVGDHHIYNCLVATAVGLAHEIDLPTIVRGLEALDYIPGRMQRIECGQPFRVFVDYAHTPDGLRAALMTLREVTDGRLICVFGAGGDRDRRKRPLMGRQVTNFADMAIVTDDNPRSEDSSRIIADILDGIDETIDVCIKSDRAAAIDMALSSAQEGDCVLIAGKGHEGCQIVGKRQIWFDDAEIAKSRLYEMYSSVLSIAPRRAA
jgi:UDP-N-acetylmuramoyl-L-alanyl-D-glutamate--2,6-diaminopimelate ligase